MNQKYNSDFKHLIQSIKDYSRSYYINSLFVERRYYSEIILFMYLEVELNKLIVSNSERNIIIGKFTWWKNYLILSSKNDVPMVPFFKVYHKINGQNKLILNKYINFIDRAEKLYEIQSYNKERKYYIDYIRSRNKIFKYILKIHFKERKLNKVLNLLILSVYYRSIKNINLSNLIIDRARKYNKRPLKRDLFIFIIHLSYNKISYFKQIIKLIFRYW